MTLQQVSEVLKKFGGGAENIDFSCQFQQPPPVYYTTGGGNSTTTQIQDVGPITSTTTQPNSTKGRKSSKNNCSNFTMPIL